MYKDVFNTISRDANGQIDWFRELAQIVKYGRWLTKEELILKAKRLIVEYAQGLKMERELEDALPGVIDQVFQKRPNHVRFDEVVKQIRRKFPALNVVSDDRGYKIFCTYPDGRVLNVVVSCNADSFRKNGYVLRRDADSIVGRAWANLLTCGYVF